MRLWNPATDQMFVGSGIAKDNGGGIFHCGMKTGSVLDLAKFDPISANFDLSIGAAEELDIAVGKVTDAITGAVDALAGLEWVRQKFLSCEFGGVEVLECEAIAAGEEFARDADGHGLEETIENISLSVGDGFADGNKAVVESIGIDGFAGGEGGVFGGAITVDETAGGNFRLELAEMGVGGGITAGEKLAERFEGVDLFFDHQIEEAGREPECGNAALEDGSPEIFERDFAVGRDAELAAVEQGPPDFEGGGVERRGGVQEKDLVGTEVCEVGIFNEAHDCAMRHDDAFGHSGGTGGEHDVGGAFGRNGGETVVARGRGDGARAGAIEQERTRAGMAEFIRVPQVSEDSGGGAIAREQCESFHGVIWIERDVSRAGFEHRENGDDEIDAAVEANGDEGTWGNSGGGEVAGERFGALVQSFVGECFGFEFQRDGARGGERLGMEKSADGCFARIGALRSVPGLDDLVVFFAGKDGELPNGIVRCGEHRFQEAQVMLEDALDGRGVEQGSAILHDGGE